MLILFEDQFAGNFYPLSLTRHVSDLLVGTMTQRQRAMRLLSESGSSIHGRSYIRYYYQGLGNDVQRPRETTLFINARALVTAGLISQFPEEGEWLLVQDDTVIAARLEVRSINLLDWDAEYLDFSCVPTLAVHDVTEVRLFNYLWDLIYANGEVICMDGAPEESSPVTTLPAGSYLTGGKGFFGGPGTSIQPGVVIDATQGPVILGSNVEVMASAVIAGPCFIGNNSRIKIGAKIYEKTSVGPWCKVGGEVENSIILGFANKQHDGFLGHSYLGTWVNLGADTNTSDLKNNYGNIRVHLAGEQVNTGSMFLGALIGDHTKAGINTMFNTGTVAGVSANIFGGGFPPKEIPSFGWGGAEKMEKFRLDKAIELATIVMARRGIDFTAADAQLLSYLWKNESHL